MYIYICIYVYIYICIYIRIYIYLYIYIYIIYYIYNIMYYIYYIHCIHCIHTYIYTYIHAMTQHAMPCHAIPVQYIAYAKFSFGHHPNPRLSKFAQVDVLRDALKDVLHVVEIFSAQSEAREPRTRNRSLDPR